MTANAGRRLYAVRRDRIRGSHLHYEMTRQVDLSLTDDMPPESQSWSVTVTEDGVEEGY
jgi:hypothetical protein